MKMKFLLQGGFDRIPRPAHPTLSPDLCCSFSSFVHSAFNEVLLSVVIYQFMYDIYHKRPKISNSLFHFCFLCIFFLNGL